VWFTKGDDYVFKSRPIRVPQKYPGKKAFKGPKKGPVYLATPLGKKSGDGLGHSEVKPHHVEKTADPCQFPIRACLKRLILALTQ